MRVIFLVLLVTGTLLAQGSTLRPPTWNHPDANRHSEEKVALGKDLFHSPLLSQSRMVSCATCHDPKASFVDGLPQSRGVLDTVIGRNTPTLWGIGMAPGFIGSKETSSGKTKPKLLSLEDRCLSPIENPIEMGSSIPEALAALEAAPGMKKRFKEAFGSSGKPITEERLGQALACYLRSIPLPNSPYIRFLEGDLDALKPQEVRGLALFKGRGKCAECHSGDYLSNGLVYASAPVGSLRGIRQSKSRMQLLRDLRQRARDLPPQPDGKKADRKKSELTPKTLPHPETVIAGVARGGGGYGNTPGPVNQTPTLWDVARTAPYFRDGSETDLVLAVRQHVHELQTAGLQTGGCDGMNVTPPVIAKLPEQLRPPGEQFLTQPRPPILTPQEFDDLVAFLATLSPRSQGDN